MTIEQIRGGILKPGERLDTLDGMRGFAALAVVAHHFLARWAEPQFSPTLYPHGDALAEFFPLQIAGSFGVLLFFLISGFVIMMTLERARGLMDFAGRRAARLWPAMLFCATASAILINTSGVAFQYENVERWHVTWVEYFSSLIFVPPDLTAGLLGIEQADQPGYVEGVYWTLWAEVRFYALIVLAYLVSPRQAFLWVWAALQGVSTLLDMVAISGGAASLPGWPVWALVFQPDLLCWFTFGLVAWKARSGERSPALWIAAGFAGLSLATGNLVSLEAGGFILHDGIVSTGLLYLSVFTPFALFLAGSRLLAPLRWRPMIAIGLASYPLYLFHERVGMIYLRWLNDIGLGPWIALAVTTAIIIASALAIHRYIEDPAKRLILTRWRPFAEQVETRFPRLRFSAQPKAASGSPAR